MLIAVLHYFLEMRAHGGVSMTLSSPMRAVAVVVALVGAFLALALRSTSALISYDSEKIWIALLSQHYLFFNAVLKKKNSDLKLVVPSMEPFLRTFFHSQEETLYDWSASTEENYRSKHPTACRNYGPFKSIRDHLDGRFHATYSRARQRFQDSVIESFLNETQVHTVNGRSCGSPDKPWIVFTAGAMGSGKSHTIKLLDQTGRFPLHSFVTVDPDQIRHRLPEFDGYVERCPLTAGELTRKECGMMAEILTEAALQSGKNVLVDGSLRNASWYRTYFEELRLAHPLLQIAIFHITAPRDAVFARAAVRQYLNGLLAASPFCDIPRLTLSYLLPLSSQSRSKVTGRVVPNDLLEQTLVEVPKSVSQLQPFVNFSIEIHNRGTAIDNNTGDVQVVTQGMNWELFEAHWMTQVCPHHHHHHHHHYLPQ